MITRFCRWLRYRRALGRLMADATALGDPVRSRWRYDEMREQARLAASS